MDRRAMLGWSVATSAALAMARASDAFVPRRRCADIPMFYDWKPTRVPHVLVARGAGGNMVLILGAGGRGAILIDTQACPYGPQIRREAEQLGGKVELLVCTHHHPEITGGNRAFTADTRVLGHARNAARIAGQMNRYISQVKEFLVRKEDPAKKEAMAAIRADFVELHKHKGALKPEEFAPNETLDADRKEITIAGRRLVLVGVSGSDSRPGAHTDNDVAVHLPEEDVLIAGGVLSPELHAVVDRDAGADTRGWCAALEKLELLCTPKTVVIPGEGDVGGETSLPWQRGYLTTLRAAVEKGVAEGRNRQEIRALTPELGVASGNSGSRLMMSLDAVFDEVRADRAPAGEVREPK